MPFPTLRICKYGVAAAYVLFSPSRALYITELLWSLLELERFFLESVVLEKYLLPHLDVFQMVELNPATVVLTLCGIVCCFFGHRTTKLFLDLSGFAVLGLLAALTVGFFSDGNVPYMSVALMVGGILGAIITHMAYRLGIILFGGGIITLAAWNYLQPTWDSGILFAFVILAALVGGLASFFLERFTISLITAGLGAWFTVQGVFLILQAMGVSSEGEEAAATLKTNSSIGLSWLLLAALGFLFQLIEKKFRKASG
jgi:membrane-associated HD superfamily phosphohydrolase